MEKENITVNPEPAAVAAKKARAKKSTLPPQPEEVRGVAPDPSESVQPITEESAAESAAEPAAESVDLGKFKSVDALLRAYRELEAEFTRRSQKLKALEDAAPQMRQAEELPRVSREEELYRAVTENEGVRARVLTDYLKSLKGVPLMTSGGAGAKAPAEKPKSIRDAGNLALGYLRNHTK